MFPIAFQFPRTNIDCFLTFVTSSQLKRWRRENRLDIARLEIVQRGRRRIIKKYQRARERRRIEEIKRFLTRMPPHSVLRPILPQNVVFNVRENFKYKILNSKFRLCKLPDNLRFHVVDGQHRIEALLDLEEDIPIPLTIIRGLSEMEEGALFLQINHKQKTVPAEIRFLNIARMRVSRHRRLELMPLFEILGFRDVDKKALDIAAEQVLDSRHFWFHRTKLPRTEE